MRSWSDKRGAKDTHSETHRLKINWHSMAKKIKRHTPVHKTQHRKLKTKQHEPQQKLGVISGAPEGLSDHAAPVVLLMFLQTQ